MTYDEARDADTLTLLDGAIEQFILQCQRPDNPGSNCARQTVFFFPGGMASRLTRATEKFRDDDPSPQTFHYEPVWVTPATPFGGAVELAMHRSGVTFRDKSDRIIIADEALSLAGCTPHTGLINWAQHNNIDLFVFPWDWRRRLDETVTFFLGPFLTRLRTRVQAAGCSDPVGTFALVGHSFGGMITNLILRSGAPVLAGLTHAITVGTPFYGYAGQVPRWFMGEDYLNFFGILEQAMIETISSLPGLYTLHFPDEQTFNANEVALGTGDFPLVAYPSMDDTQNGVRADPYDPDTYAGLVRYPATTGFDLSELGYGRGQFQLLASPMDPALATKFHNIRGVKTAADDTTPLNNTIGSVTWGWITANFDAKDAPPIHNGPNVPGDDTQPAFTTCLVSNRDRCVTVKDHKIEHAFLMNHTGVLEAIQAIFCPQGGAVGPLPTPEPEPASDQEVVDYLTVLSRNVSDVRRAKSFEDLERLKLVPPEMQRRLPNIARRFLSDVMKRPGPRGLRPEGGGDGGGRRP